MADLAGSDERSAAGAGFGQSAKGRTAGAHRGGAFAHRLDETPRKGEAPRAYALRLAREKAHAVPREAGEVVLAGDTTVALGRRILSKAETGEQVAVMLAMLSGRRHACISAVAVVGHDGQLRSRVAETVVAFKRLSPDEIADYVASGEGLGKAGGYAIQGRAEALIRFIHGSHSGVMGLPLFETRALLRAAGIPVG